MILLQNQSYRHPSAVARFLPPLIVLGTLALIAWNVNWTYLSGLDFSVVYEYRMALLAGLANTVMITVLSLVVGAFCGTVFAVLLHVGPRPVVVLIQIYVEIWRNIPLIVMLFWVHFSMPQVTGISTTAMVSGCIAISLQAAAYLTDIARAGIRSVPRGQFEAADSVGLSGFHKWVYIVTPQAAKLMIGPLLNVTLSFFKATSILGVLSIGELLHAGVRVSDYSFKPIEVLTIVALVYLVVGFGISAVARSIERKYRTGG